MGQEGHMGRLIFQCVLARYTVPFQSHKYELVKQTSNRYRYDLEERWELAIIQVC